MALLCVIFALRCVERRYFYPIKYKEEVLLFSKEFDLPPSLVFAVINVESGFDDKAVSDKGAEGLMQITPSTADFIADRLYVKTYDIFDPKDNILFGCYYLNYLKRRFSSLDIAVIAYNAGEGNVALWLKEGKIIAEELNKNAIPFKETREYLIKIEKTRKKYQKLYSQIVDK